MKMQKTTGAYTNGWYSIGVDVPIRIMYITPKTSVTTVQSIQSSDSTSEKINNILSAVLSSERMERPHNSQTQPRLTIRTFATRVQFLRSAAH